MLRKTTNYLAVITVVALTALTTTWFVSTRLRPVTGNSASASRLLGILESGEIRCGYIVYAPYFRKDTTTGELSGIFHDLMEDLGRRANLKIRWVEENGYVSIFTSLESGRYDVYAGGLWPNANRAKSASFTIPAFFSVVKAWGRSDEVRFRDLQGINDPNVTIATIDGVMDDLIARADFPRARRTSLSQSSPFTHNFANVISHKADITFSEPGIIREFLQEHPATLKELAPETPVRVFGNSLVVPRGDLQLQEFLNVSLLEALNNRAVETILAKYESAPGMFPRVAVPYELEKAALK
jgi:ABC-type amino acid transport substrate-binding protein